MKPIWIWMVIWWTRAYKYLNAPEKEIHLGEKADKLTPNQFNISIFKVILSFVYGKKTFFFISFLFCIYFVGFPIHGLALTSLRSSFQWAVGGIV